MSPVERLEAAIEKLETLRAGSASDLPWSSSGGVVEVWDDRTDSGAVIFRPTVRWSDRVAAHNASLVVTLHRTIDAQLDLLRLARGFYGAQITGPEAASAFAESVLALTDAILGETQ